MIHPLVSDLFVSCPFLPNRLEDKHFDLPTVVFGGVATLLIDGRLPAEQADSVFGYFNQMAERGGSEAFDVLGTGAIEMFNDNPTAQRLGRAKLKGRALEMLEEFRRSWGQPDYGAAQ